MAEIEGGRTVPMLCSTLTMAFSTCAAAMMIAVVPAVSGASYLQPDFAPQMALITADTSRPELPSMVSIGMARICYKSPGITCLPWAPGLSVDPVAFEGAAKWQRVLPAVILTQIWAGLSIGACLLTLATAFTSFCKGAPAGARWGFLLLAVLSNGAYFIVTAILFFLLRDRIESGTEYVPKAVVITSIVYIVPLGMLLLIPIITFFLPTSEYANSRAGPDIIINAKNPKLEELMLRMEAMLGRINPNGSKTGEDGNEKVGEDGLTESRRKKITARVLAQLQRQLAKLNKEAPDLNARRAKHNAETAHASDTVKERTVEKQIKEIEKLHAIGITPEDAKRQLRRRKMLEEAEKLPAQRQGLPDNQVQLGTNAPPVPPKKSIKRKKKLEDAIPPAAPPFKARPAPSPAPTKPLPETKPALIPAAAQSKVVQFQKMAYLARAATQKDGNRLANIAAAAALGGPAPPNPHEEVLDSEVPQMDTNALKIIRKPVPKPDVPQRKPVLPTRSKTTPAPASNTAQVNQPRAMPQKAPTALYPTRNDLMPVPDIAKPVPVRSPSPANIPLPDSLPDNSRTVPAIPKVPAAPQAKQSDKTEALQTKQSTEAKPEMQQKHESVAMAWK